MRACGVIVDEVVDSLHISVHRLDKVILALLKSPILLIVHCHQDFLLGFDKLLLQTIIKFILQTL